MNAIGENVRSCAIVTPGSPYSQRERAMPNHASSQPVTMPVRPNSTTSASAITNGGVTIGRIDISFSTPE